MRRLTVSLLVAGCLLALAACGGEGGGGTKAVSADLYTGTVCTALSIWQEQLESASAVLAEKTNTATSLKAVRMQFVTFFGGAIAETDDMLTAVEEAGVPDVTDGEEVVASLLQSLRTFRPILVEAQAKARQLPVGNEKRFTTQTQTLGTRFSMESAKLATLWETLGESHDVPELTAAARAHASCQEL